MAESSSGLESVYVQPDVRRKRITVSADAPAGERLDLSLSGEEQTTLEAPGEVRLDLPEFEAWSPEDPVVYSLLCETSGGGDGSESCSISFGMREFTVKDGRFSLNQRQLDDIAARFNVPAYLVHAVCELQGVNQHGAAYWQRRATLHHQLAHRLHDLEAAVKQAMAQTPRASSIVENLNSRLRNYFFLRRHVGDDYLHLLRFYLNHRCFLRSDRPEWVGQSPAQLLTGQAHGHWLELLGYERFSRN